LRNEKKRLFNFSLLSRRGEEKKKNSSSLVSQQNLLSIVFLVPLETLKKCLCHKRFGKKPSATQKKHSLVGDKKKTSKGQKSRENTHTQ